MKKMILTFQPALESTIPLLALMIFTAEKILFGILLKTFSKTSVKHQINFFSF